MTRGWSLRRGREKGPSRRTCGFRDSMSAVSANTNKLVNGEEETKTPRARDS